MSRLVISLLTLALVVLASPRARAFEDSDFKAKVYDQESGKQKLLFTYQRKNEQKNDLRVGTSTYFDPASPTEPVAIETTEFAKDGAIEKVVSYHMSQKQIGAEGQIDVSKDKINFTFAKNGSTKKSEETLTDNFVVGPSIVLYLQRHWDEISKGDKIKIRFGVPDRAETVGFEFFKDRDESVTNDSVTVKTWVIKMKPSSFIIAALVKPLFFYMLPDGSRLIEVHGRTQLKRKVDGSYKDLDAVTVYDYASGPVPAPGSVNSK